MPEQVCAGTCRAAVGLPVIPPFSFGPDIDQPPGGVDRNDIVTAVGPASKDSNSRADQACDRVTTARLRRLVRLGGRPKRWRGCVRPGPLRSSTAISGIGCPEIAGYALGFTAGRAMFRFEHAIERDPYARKDFCRRRCVVSWLGSTPRSCAIASSIPACG